MAFPTRDDYVDTSFMVNDRGVGASVGGRLRPSALNTVTNVAHVDTPGTAINQYVESSIVTLANDATTECGAYCRFTSTNPSYYEWMGSRNGGSSLDLTIYKYIGSFSVITSLPANVSWNPPHLFAMRARGATIECWLDGVLKYTFVDPDSWFLNGSCGTRVWSSSAVANSEAEYAVTDDPGGLGGGYLVGVLGTANNTTATGPPNTLSVAYTGTEKPRAGDTILVWFARDNITNDPATGDSLSTQPGSETYTRVALAQPSGTSTAAAGIVGGCFYAKLAANWSAGTNTVTITMPTGAADRVMSVEWWRGLGPLRGSAFTNGSTTNASTTATNPVTGDAVLAMNCWEHSAASTITDDTDTTNGTWSRGLRALGSQVASAGTTTAAVKMSTQSKSPVTATGSQTFNPTNSTTTDSVGIVLVFTPAPVPEMVVPTRKLWYPAVRRAANW